jgi:glycerophosphoryl diester phosphodiesterase
MLKKEGFVAEHIVTTNYSAPPAQHPGQPAGIVTYNERDIRIIAHRGIHAQYPENSMPAFEAAAKLGFGIEVDVWGLRKGEGEFVVTHDPFLRRITGGKDLAPVIESTPKKLKKINLSHDPDQFIGIPSLKQVLKLADEYPNLDFTLDWKIFNPAKIRKYTERLVKKLDKFTKNYPSNNITVISFLPESLEVIKDLSRGRIKTGFLMHPLNPYNFGWKTTLDKCDYALTTPEMANKWVPRILDHDPKKQIICYWAPPERAVDLVEMGCRALITDYPLDVRDNLLAASTR